MSWVTRKIDMVIAAVFATAGGMAFSQTRAFIQQYTQRLGGHIDEARINLERVLDSSREALGPSVEALRPVIAHSRERLEYLEGGYRALVEADAWTQPLVFLRVADEAIARGTAELFEPALPLGTESLVFTFLGILLALIVYELLKAPGYLMAHRSRRAEHRRRVFESRTRP